MSIIVKRDYRIRLEVLLLPVLSCNIKKNADY